MNSAVNLTFEAPTNATTQFLGPNDIVNILNVLFGLPIHTYIIWLIVTATRSGFASGFFNLNLSVCEIGICLYSLCSLLESVIESPFIIIQTPVLVGLAITGRPLFQCLICVERYLAVVHPVTYLKSKPLRYRLICCTVAWIFTLGSCLSCALTINVYDIFTWFFCIQYLLFFSIQLFCLVAVLRALKQSGPGDRRRVEENHMKRRAFFLILITTVSMTIIYVPFIISGLIYIVTNMVFPDLYNAGVCCFLLAGFVQPVLYLNGVGKFSGCLDLKILW